MLITCYTFIYWIRHERLTFIRMCQLQCASFCATFSRSNSHHWLYWPFDSAKVIHTRILQIFAFGHSFNLNIWYISLFANFIKNCLDMHPIYFACRKTAKSHKIWLVSRISTQLCHQIINYFVKWGAKIFHWDHITIGENVFPSFIRFYFKFIFLIW